MIEKTLGVVSVSRHVIYGCCCRAHSTLRSVDGVVAVHSRRYDEHTAGGGESMAWRGHRRICDVDLSSPKQVTRAT